MLANNFSQKITCLFFLLLLQTGLFAQDDRILVINSQIEKMPVISIRYYPTELLAVHGVNVYRQEKDTDTWEKLNANPIKQGSYQVPAIFLQKDSILAKIVKGGGISKPEKIQDLAKAFLLIQFIQKEELARYTGLQFDDSTALAGKTYRYKVMRLAEDGKEKMLNTSEFIEKGDYKPLPKIENFTVKRVGNKLVKFHWAIDKNRFFAYNVYRAPKGGYHVARNKAPIVISKITEPTTRALIYPDYFFTDSVTVDRSYQYFVRGIDYFGRESEASEPVELHTKDQEPPPSPVGFGENMNKLQTVATFGWKMNPVPDKDLDGFNIFRSEKRNEGYEKINATMLSQFTFTFEDSPKVSGTYYYYLTAVDRAENWSSSDTISVFYADQTAPETPQGLEAKGEEGKIIITWQANKDADLLGYRLYRSASGTTKEASLMFERLLRDTVYVDSLSKNIQNTFSYFAIAYDSMGNQSNFSKPARARMPDVLAPERPTIKNIGVGEKHLVLNWYANIEPDLKTYKVFRSEDETDFRLMAQVSKDSVFFRDDSIRSDVKYQYYLEALDSAGNISQKSEVYGGGMAHFPEMPLAKEIQIEYDSASQKVNIRWKILPKNELLGCIIYRKINAEAEELHASSNMISEENYSDPDIEKGQSYLYQIRVFGKKGQTSQSELLKIEIKQ